MSAAAQRALWALCASFSMLCQLQIHRRAGYKAFRDDHAARGADVAAAVSACCSLALVWLCAHQSVSLLEVRRVAIRTVSSCQRCTGVVAGAANVCVHRLVGLHVRSV